MKQDELNLIIAFLEKSKQKLKSAVDLIKNNDFDDSVSRSYYCIYHCTKALLKTKGIEPSTHEGLFRMFSLHFVKEGIFKQDFSKIFSFLQNERENGDYGIFNVFTIVDAEDAVRKAKLFYNESIAYLRNTYPQLMDISKGLLENMPVE